MSNPHVLVMPAPSQGHVIPLLEFSQCLARHGVRVTFVNSEYSHERILKSLEGKNYIDEKIHLVSIPDGMEPWEDRSDLRKLIERTIHFFPRKLQELVEEFNRKESEKIDCVITDMSIEVAEKRKIRQAVFWTASATSLALSLNIPKLIDDGIIDQNGTPIKKQIVLLAPDMPPINSSEFYWTFSGDPTSKKLMFELGLSNSKKMKMADYVFCNSTHDLEPAAFAMIPELQPVGPLLASNRLGNSAGYFWPEDSTCLQWLDQQPPNSVLFVAFGSITVLDKLQFQELALGLELCNRPFLWVVRPDISNDSNEAYPEGYRNRVVNRGRIVNWVPQQEVLGHPSVACFFSHCGWNSTIEGVSNGVPFLCWPYYADQLLNENYICDIWKVGLKLCKNESGIVTREEIKTKVDEVQGNESLKARALELKEKAMSSVREGGSSNKTFQNFIQWLKA